MSVDKRNKVFQFVSERGILPDDFKNDKGEYDKGMFFANLDNEEWRKNLWQVLSNDPNNSVGDYDYFNEQMTDDNKLRYSVGDKKFRTREEAQAYADQNKANYEARKKIEQGGSMTQQTAADMNGGDFGGGKKTVKTKVEQPRTAADAEVPASVVEGEGTQQTAANINGDNNGGANGTNGGNGVNGGNGAAKKSQDEQFLENYEQMQIASRSAKNRRQSFFELMKKAGYVDKNDFNNPGKFFADIDNPEKRKKLFELLKKDDRFNFGEWEYKDFDATLTDPERMRYKVNGSQYFTKEDAENAVAERKKRKANDPYKRYEELVSLVDKLKKERKGILLNNPNIEREKGYFKELEDKLSDAQKEMKLLDDEYHFKPIDDLNNPEFANVALGRAMQKAKDDALMKRVKEIDMRVHGADFVAKKEEKGGYNVEEKFAPTMSEILADYQSQLEDVNKKLSEEMGKEMAGRTMNGVMVVNPGNEMPTFSPYADVSPLATRKHMLEQAIQAINDGVYTRDSGDGGGGFTADTWLGLKRGLLKKDNLTFGMFSAIDAVNLYTAAERYKDGRATDGDIDLLNASAQNAFAQQYLDDNSGYGYSTGLITGEMIPFMVEMGISPIAIKEGKLFEKGVIGTASKKTADWISRHAAKVLGKTVGKGVGVGIAGAGELLARGTGMALTTGLNYTIGDYLNRRAGNVQYDYNENGVEFDGINGGEDIASSIYKAVLGQAFERTTEMSGALGAKALGKLIGKKSLGKLAAKFNSWSPEGWRKCVKGIMKDVKWDGPFMEYFEEVENNILNATFIGDMNWGSGDNGVFNLEQNIKTFLGVALTGTMFLIAQAGEATSSYVKYKKAAEDLSSANLLNPLNNAIKDVPIDEIPKVLETFITENKLTSYCAKRACQYVRYKLALEYEDANKSASNVEKGVEAVDSMVEEERSGQSETQQESQNPMSMIGISYNESEKAINELEPICKTMVDDLISGNISPNEYKNFLQSLSPEEQKIMEDYKNACQKMSGVMEGINERVAEYRARITEWLRRQLSGSELLEELPENYYMATIDGQRQYLINYNPDSDRVYYRDVEGNVVEVQKENVEDITEFNTQERIDYWTEIEREYDIERAEFSLQYPHVPSHYRYLTTAEEYGKGTVVHTLNGYMMLMRKDEEGNYVLKMVETEEDGDATNFNPVGEDIVMSKEQLYDTLEEYYAKKEAEDNVEENAVEGGADAQVGEEETNGQVEGTKNGEGTDVQVEGTQNGEGTQQTAADMNGDVVGGENGGVVVGGENGGVVVGGENGGVTTMPMDENGEPLYVEAGAERSAAFIYGESGLEEDDADLLIENKIKKAKDELKKAKKDKPNATTIVEMKAERAAINERKAAAEQELVLWEGIKEARKAQVEEERKAQIEAEKMAQIEASNAAAIEAEKEAAKVEEETVAEEENNNGEESADISAETEQDNNQTNIKDGKDNSGKESGNQPQSSGENGLLESASAAIRGHLEASGRKLTDRAGRRPQEETDAITQSAVEWAKRNGRLIPIEDLRKNNVASVSGTEHSLFVSPDGNKFLKMNNLAGETSSDILMALERMIMHNELFPQTAYEFEGLVLVDELSGLVLPLFSQNIVQHGQVSNEKQIEDYMKSIGFTKNGEGSYTDGKIVVSDLFPRNVLVDNEGNIYPIDADFKMIDGESAEVSAETEQVVKQPKTAATVEEIVMGDKGKGKKKQSKKKDNGKEASKGKETRKRQGGLVENEAVAHISEESRNVLDTMGRQLGIDIVVDDTLPKNVRGAYSKKKNRIRINANLNTREKVMFAFGHEVTHMIRTELPEVWDQYVQFVRRAFGEEAFESQVAKEKKLRDAFVKKNNLEPLTYDDVVEEVICNIAGEHVLMDENYVAELIKLADNAGVDSKSLVERILQLLDEAMSAIKELISSKGSNEYAGTLESLNDVKDCWGRMYEAVVAKRNSEIYNNAKSSSKKLSKEEIDNECITEEVSNELNKKGLTISGGVAMDEKSKALKDEIGYETPIEQDEKLSYGTRLDWMDKFLLGAVTERMRKMAESVLEFYERSVTNEMVRSYMSYNEFPSSLNAEGKGPLRKNVEYIFTFDLDTSCPRTLQFLSYAKEIEKRIGRPLKRSERVILVEKMRAYGQMIPCTYCYSENKRQELSQHYINYIYTRSKVINAATDEEAIQYMYGKNNKGELSKAAQEVFDEWRKKDGINQYAWNIETLSRYYHQSRSAIMNYLDDTFKDDYKTGEKTISKSVFEHFGINPNIDKGAKTQIINIVQEWRNDKAANISHEDVDEEITDIERYNVIGLDIWDAMCKYGASASSAHKVVRYFPYTSQLSEIPEEDKVYINSMGGLRMHSSNDFRIDYIGDYLQLIADMDKGKWMGHTYTKSPLFVKIFGNTGYRINMSLAAYDTIDENGNVVVVMNEDEGFNWEVARDLRSKFINAGTMFMATSPAQLQAALDADWIDMIIPFHTSGLPKNIWYNLRHWYNYTSVQTEKYVSSSYMKSRLKDAGVEVPKNANAAEISSLYDSTFNIKKLYDNSSAMKKELKDAGISIPNGTNYDGLKKLYIDTFGHECKEKGERIRPHFLPEDSRKGGNIIPGHGNDVQRYIQLCEEYGVKPRFQGITVRDADGNDIDITQHPGYIKLLKETARTDTPQGQVVFNLDQPSDALGINPSTGETYTPIDYAFDELEDFANKGGYASLSEDPFGIVDSFINDVVEYEKETGKERPLNYLSEQDKEWASTMRKAEEMSSSNREKRIIEIKELPYHEGEDIYDTNEAPIDEDEADDEKFSIREEEPPTKTKTAYAVFIVKKHNDGSVSIHPKMIEGDEVGTPVLTWLNADTGKIKRDKDGNPILNTKGRVSVTDSNGKSLSWRPGKHLAYYPNASQFFVADENGEKTKTPDNVIFFEVEYADDVNYQYKAWEYGVNKNGNYEHSQAGLPYIPKDGSYIYRTNANPNIPPMIITGAYKVKRALTDEEAKKINQENGGRWGERKSGNPVTEETLKGLGLDEEGMKRMADNFDYGKVSAPYDESEVAKKLPGYTRRELDFNNGNLQDAIEENKKAGGESIEYYRDGYEFEDDEKLSVGEEDAFVFNRKANELKNIFATFTPEELGIEVEEYIERKIDAEIGEGFDVDRDYDLINSFDDETYNSLTRPLTNNDYYKAPSYDRFHKQSKEDLYDNGDLEEIKSLIRTNLTEQHLSNTDWIKKNLKELVNSVRFKDEGKTSKEIKNNLRLSDEAGVVGGNVYLDEKSIKLLNKKDKVYRGINEFEDGQVLKVKEDELGGEYSVEGLGGRYSSRERLLEQFRRKYGDYIARLNEDGDIVIERLDKEPQQPKSKKQTVQDIVFASREVKRMVDAVEKMAEKLGVKVNVVKTKDGLEGKDKKAKGWYDPSTGEITIVVPNNRNVDDVMRTLLHEAVAHHGLRELFGANFDTFLDNVFNNIPIEIRNEIMRNAIEKYGMNRRKATEEYLASIAEDMDFERAGMQSWWGKVKMFFLEMLEKAGLKIRGGLSDADIRSILWRSYDNLKNRGGRVKYAPGERSYKSQGFEYTYDDALVFPKESVADEETRLYRDSDASNDPTSSTYMYEKLMDKKMYVFTAAFGNGLQALDNIQKALEKATGKPIRGFENVVYRANALPSVDGVDVEKFKKNYLENLVEAAKMLFGKKKILGLIPVSKINDAEREELKRYMFSKHGLERNEVFAMRDATKEARENEGYDKKIEDLKAMLKDGSITQEEYDAQIESLDNKVAAEAEKLVGKYRKTDYSGLTALFDIDQEEEDAVAKAEAMAKMYVDSFEGAREGAAIGNFWNWMNATTRSILDKQYECGMITEEQYNRARTMFDYYVPLRGFAEDTAEDVYNYINSSSNTSYQAPIKKANKRSSEADDPFAYIVSMAMSGILSGNRNLRVKQAFYNLALSHKTPLLSTGKVYARIDELTGEYETIYPDIPSNATAEQASKIVDEFEKKMEELVSEKPEEYVCATDNLKIPYRLLSKTDKEQHQVIVKRGGKPYVVYVNGNPAAAQAINGAFGKSLDIPILKDIIMFMSKAMTTRNPKFIPRNFIRDALSSRAITFIKEGESYNLAFRKNWWICAGALMKVMPKYHFNTIEEQKKYQGYYKQFVENGGETGYAFLKDMESTKKEINKMFGKMSFGSYVVLPFKKFIDLMDKVFSPVNAWAETVSRFAAFVTSMERGRGVDQSIRDAKEVSVNFNTKGAGSGILGSNSTRTDKTIAYASEILRALYLFVNPSIQGMRLFGNAIKEHPVRGSIWIAEMTALGFFMPLINGWLQSLYDGGDGDDKNKDEEEDDKYNKLPDYVKRNNINVYASSDVFASIPLSQENRVPFGIGELMYSQFVNKEYTDEEFRYKLLCQITQMMPVDINEGGAGYGGLVPTFFKPLLEAGDNKSWNGYPIWKGYYGNNDTSDKNPMWTRDYEYNRDYLTDISKSANEISGGNDYKKGDLDWNPAKVRYVMNGYLGGLTKYPISVGKLVSMIWNEDARTMRNMPLLSGLTSTVDNNEEKKAINKEYHEVVGEAERYLKTIKDYLEASNDSARSEKEREMYKALYDIAMQDTLELRKNTIVHDMKYDISQMKRQGAELTELANKVFVNRVYDAATQDELDSVIEQRPQTIDRIIGKFNAKK